MPFFKRLKCWTWTVSWKQCSFVAHHFCLVTCSYWPYSVPPTANYHSIACCSPGVELRSSASERFSSKSVFEGLVQLIPFLFLFLFSLSLFSHILCSVCAESVLSWRVVEGTVFISEGHKWPYRVWGRQCQEPKERYRIKGLAVTNRRIWKHEASRNCSEIQGAVSECTTMILTGRYGQLYRRAGSEPCLPSMLISLLDGSDGPREITKRYPRTGKAFSGRLLVSRVLLSKLLYHFGGCSSVALISPSMKYM